MVRPTIHCDGAAGWAIILSAHVRMWARFRIACTQQAVRRPQNAKSTSRALDAPTALAAKRRRLSQVGSTETEDSSY